jgi:D-alanyl-D-alanine carboxypeptidase
MNKVDSVLQLFEARWKVIFITVVAGFLMSVLPQAGITVDGFSFSRDNEVVSPLPKSVDPLKNIYPLLEKKLNNFQLKRESSLLSTAHASSNYDEARAYIAIDFDSGKILAEKQAEEPVPIASLTKIMTSVVALDLASPQEEFTVSLHAQEIEPTKIGVVAGQKLTLDELLQALMMTSANDAGEVIKEGINTKYGSEIFIKAMNAKAEVLGLKNTHFENPQGFDGREHYSSAADLAILTNYALKNYPLITQIVAKEYSLLEKNHNHKQFDLYNWNGLLDVYPGASGVKIGNTGRAKKTTVVLSEREGKKVLAVLLGAPGTLERDLWTSQLLDYGFEKEYGLKPVEITEEQLKEKYSTWKYWN